MSTKVIMVFFIIFGFKYVCIFILQNYKNYPTRQRKNCFLTFFVKIGVFINIYIADCLGGILLKLL